MENVIWEYKVEDLPYNREDHVNRLNELGIEGWELCGIIGDGTFYMVLKRVKLEPSVAEISASFI